MRISDWSSDVCSSDLRRHPPRIEQPGFRSSEPCRLQSTVHIHICHRNLKRDKGGGGMTRRVVVTGLGVVTPLGVGVEPVWNRLILGHSGLVRLPDAIAADLPARVAGMVPDKDDDPAGLDRKSVVEGKSVSVRVDLGGRRIITKKQ